MKSYRYHLMPHQSGFLILIWLLWFATYIPSGWVDVGGPLSNWTFPHFLFAVISNYLQFYVPKMSLYKNYSTHFNLVFYQMGSVWEEATLVGSWLVPQNPKWFNALVDEKVLSYCCFCSRKEGNLNARW